MDSANLNTCPDVSIPGSSDASIKEELCCGNISTIDRKEYHNEIESMSILKDACMKEGASCARLCTIEIVESCKVQGEGNLSGIKLEHPHNEVNLTENPFRKASGTDKIKTNNAINLDISTSGVSYIKLESPKRTGFFTTFGEFVQTDINKQKVRKDNEEIVENVYNDNTTRHGGIENSDVNIFAPEGSVEVKIDSLSTHCDIPYTIEELAEKYALKAENPTNIVCCPDIMGEIVQSHAKKRKKMVKQTDDSRKKGKLGQIDVNEHGRVAFIDVNTEICPITPYRCEELNRCEKPFPIISSQKFIDPVEEFILPDILPVKSQARLDNPIIAPMAQCVEFTPNSILKKELMKVTNLKKDKLTDFRPKMKKFIMDDFNKITGQNKAHNLPIECSQCNLTFEKRFHLKAHHKSNHSKRIFSFACSREDCNFTCYLEKGLKTHMISHTSEKPYICSLCDMAFRTRGKLTMHILTHSDTKPFKCHECSYNCSAKGDLKRHSVIHTGAKKFACTICDYACYRKDNLKAHMLTHSGEKPFPCTLCNVKCSRNGDLIRHMRTHSGERPFGCSQCNYKCLKKSDLSRHTLTHTGERRHACTLCPHVSATKSNLKLHMAIHKS